MIYKRKDQSVYLHKLTSEQSYVFSIYKKDIQEIKEKYIKVFTLASHYRLNMH